MSFVYMLMFAFAEERNVLGQDLVYIGKRHNGYDFVRGLLEGDADSKLFDLDHTYFNGVTGKVKSTPIAVEAGG